MGRTNSCLFFAICVNFNDIYYFSISGQSIFNLLYSSVIKHTYLGLACFKLLVYYLISLLILIFNLISIALIYLIVLFLSFKT